jgi:2-polyprenyl-3-methyl-5-hydroxy-6-metoxy-1,4-benzoquinol methylase
MRPAAAPPVCRCCGSAAVRSRGSKRGTFIIQDFAYLSCATCGYLFVNPFAGYEIYDDDYYRGRGPDSSVDYASEYADYRATDRILEFDDLARLATAHFSAPAPLALRPTPRESLAWLDFGCGAGGLLKYLSDLKSLRLTGHARPLEITGHDVGSYADLLRTRDGFRILNLAELQALPDAQFDVISLVEVIEHIEYPDPVIALVARLLRPGGLLLLTTGNNDCPVARRDGLAYRYYLPEIHVGIFNPRCLRTIYTRHGLIPHHVRYSGVVKFKVIKSLVHPGRRRLARIALKLPPLVRLIDLAYGVSAMPCATKPLL